MGKSAFKISKTATNKAYLGPKERDTFVAPILPLPCFVISIFFLLAII